MEFLMLYCFRMFSEFLMFSASHFLFASQERIGLTLSLSLAFHAVAYSGFYSPFPLLISGPNHFIYCLTSATTYSLPLFVPLAFLAFQSYRNFNITTTILAKLKQKNSFLL